MSALGQKRTYALQNAMSALHPIATTKTDMCQWSCPLCPPKADICNATRDVCHGPIAGISTNTGTFDAAPAQGAPIFAIKPRVLLYSAIARSSPTLFLWATPYAAAWVRAGKLQ